MKNKLRLSIIVIIGLIVGSCNKRMCCTPPTANFIHVKSGITEWDLTAPLAQVINDSLTLVGQGKEENLLVRIKFNGTGRYVLTGQQLKYYKTIGGDAVVVEYIAEPGNESVLNIHTYEQDSKTITGDFVMNFIKSSRYWDNQAYPINFGFNSGTFKIQLAK
ncbi:hypothetical protein HQ865_21070 [Mucilaginibacter mali]|uniref:Uncharacterized protein n=1 Tax=Mucilaginibacter mali TaxID=2740462 RepID=A0A7D4PW52_9SPHI|nr:hypothetical protein [Mucilaginibacter mali]QKJ32148.1 hypothetical protein HQ865_21070 [Mucilaginibacter mali]